jgi:hypothetical protein
MSIKVACLKRLHTKENCLHTHLHTHAHIRTHAHTNTHKHTRAHTNLHAQEPFWCHGRYLYDSVPSARAVQEGRKQIMQLLTSSAAMRKLKLVIFMVRRFVFMHPTWRRHCWIFAFLSSSLSSQEFTHHCGTMHIGCAWFFHAIHFMTPPSPLVMLVACRRSSPLWAKARVRPSGVPA